MFIITLIKNWFKQFYSRSCTGGYCNGDTFRFEVVDYARGRGKGNLTADRIHNEFTGHNIDNVQHSTLTYNL